MSVSENQHQSLLINITITDCYISKPGGNGIYISGCSPNIYNCEITGCSKAYPLKEQALPPSFTTIFTTTPMRFTMPAQAQPPAIITGGGTNPARLLPLTRAATGDPIYGNVNYANWDGFAVLHRRSFSAPITSPKSADPVNTATGNFTYESDGSFHRRPRG